MGKFHYKINFLFFWFGINQTSKSVANFNTMKAAEPKLAKLRVSSTVTLPLIKLKSIFCLISIEITRTTTQVIPRVFGLRSQTKKSQYNGH